MKIDLPAIKEICWCVLILAAAWRLARGWPLFHFEMSSGARILSPSSETREP